MTEESSDGTQELVNEFLIESLESLDRFDGDLLVLEANPASSEAVASVFRTLHTIKGTCGFLGFRGLEALAHAGESVLGKVRDGRLAMTTEMIDALLASGDAIRQTLASIEATGTEGTLDFAGLARQLTGSLGQGAAPSSPVAPRSPRTSTPPQRTGSPEARAEVQVQVQAPDPAVDPESGKAIDARGGVADSTIRVDIKVLDHLITLVGELVLARNQLVERAADMSEAGMVSIAQRLNLITSELQEGVMKTRMQPIGTIWGKLPRVVRDLALSCGKRVAIRLEGEETELDRSIIEAIKDPLTHLVRNAVDHAIETAEVRAKAGKPPEGTLSIRAFHEGGQVNMEVSDDGAGIDPERVRARAIQTGIVTAEAAEGMDERQLLDLIFTPGFSLAERVTAVSGRGVGTDVVRNRVERIGGSVEVQSRMGQGTTFRMKIPLTLAIIPVLVVRSGGQRYAIPQVNLLEVVREGVGEGALGIETLHDAPVYRLRGRLLPIVYLADVLGLDRASGGTDKVTDIVVLQADDRRFGLVVDDIEDSTEIVVKPLGRHLRGIEVYAGATIMGDGGVGLILDVIGLAAKAGLLNGDARESLQEPEAEVSRGEQVDGSVSFLLFSDVDDGRMAVPLELVHRLEEFPLDSIERSAGEKVVQYREEILHLVDISALLTERRKARRVQEPLRASADETIQVLVHRQGDRSVGIIVGKILDIVEQPMILQRASRAGILGTLVMGDRVTEVVDLRQLASAHMGASSIGGGYDL